MIELENGKLSYTYKTVIFNGKEYLAPLDMLPILIRNTIIDSYKNKKWNNMKGKCDNCNEKATSEWMVMNKNMANTLKFCSKCKPNRDSASVYKIYGN